LVLLELIVLLGIVKCVLCVELTNTPWGMAPQHCVHRIPAHSHVTFDSVGNFVIHPPDESIYKIKKCDEPLHHYFGAPQVYHGWQAWTAYNTSSSDGIGSFIGTFSVPNSPVQQPGILYIFTGLQNYNWIPEPEGPPAPPGFDIIQPVLEYTSGSYSLASWYVTLDAGFLESNPISINSGQHVFGNMTLTGPSTWYILSTVKETGVSTSLTVTKNRLKSQPWAYNTLEVYGVESCNQYPTEPIVFTDLLLLDTAGRKIVPTWLPLQGTQLACKEHAVVTSSTQVTIYFGNEANNKEK